MTVIAAEQALPLRDPIVDTRAAQRYPALAAEEVQRLRRFGIEQTYGGEDVVVGVGEIGHGLIVILSGNVQISRRLADGGRAPIVTHGPGSFMGELAQLSGRPSLVDAVAVGTVTGLVIPPDRLRSLLVAEAELGEQIMRALILRRVGLIESGGGGPIIIGAASDKDVLRLTNFMSRNAHPHVHMDPAEDSCAETLLDRFAVSRAELPIVLCPDGQLLRNPGEAELGRCLGLSVEIDPNRVFDVIILGAGPAGLAASVYAGSEGLSVLTLDCRSFGGQAGASARIENFLGFPTGISGAALMGRSYSQAQKFGVEVSIPAEAISLGPERGAETNHVVILANGERVRGRTVVLATGARYRRLSVPGLERFEGTSVHYWASPLEARLCAGQEIALVGGGNSAGQAAVFLAGYAARVLLLTRRPIHATMSSYLVDRIAGTSNIEVVEGAEVSNLGGRGSRLADLEWREIDSTAEANRSIRHLFLFIGADPNTDWLDGTGVTLDQVGFVRTGDQAGGDRLPLETSRRGVFAIGDVRSGSTKRVAAAAGDGAQVVASIHTFLRVHAAPADAVAPHVQAYVRTRA
jgi:thioredoxin reductase (NADPH)